MMIKRGLALGLSGGLLLVTLALPCLRAAETDAQELIQKQEQQRAIQAETERMVRQMETMIRVMQFYQLDRDEEKRMLADAAGVLSKLSQKQMSDVINE